MIASLVKRCRPCILRLKSARAGRRRDGGGGFLLIETLATFTISAFVLLGLVAASSVLLRAVDRSVAHVQDVDDLGRTIVAIDRDLSGLTRARWNGYEPQDFVFQGGPNSLFFAHRQRDADGSSETQVIALREIIANSTVKLMKGEARLSSRATGFTDLHYGPQRELGTGPTRLRFFYLPPVDGKAESVRLREWPAGQKLPAAIIIEAVARDTGRLVVSQRVQIRANADVGCLERDKADAAPAPPATPSAALAALNQSAVGIGAGRMPPATPPLGAPAEAGVPAAVENSGFCGRVDADQANDEQRRETPGPSPLGVAP